MSEGRIVAALRKHVKARRDIIDARWPKHLTPLDYTKLVGQHEELTLIETVMREAVRKSNAADKTEGDDDDE